MQWGKHQTPSNLLAIVYHQANLHHVLFHQVFSLPEYFMLCCFFRRIFPELLHPTVLKLDELVARTMVSIDLLHQEIMVMMVMTKKIPLMKPSQVPAAEILHKPSDYPSFNNYKGYEQYSNYGPPRYPSFAPNYYKGSPFYSPYFKGSKPADSGMAPASPDQMMEMMMALNNMDESSKPEDTGLLSKLISDPKSAAAAAIIPLSIVAAAVVPVLMNYMMTGAAPQVVSTTANNKESRSLDSSNNLQVVMENIVRLARAIDSDECIQKTICKVANGNDSMPVSDYMKKAASTVAQMVKDDWVNNLGVKILSME
ncbi:uncharacterized protein CEXT_376311 [Caerostris extrusa]|uniref:Uncharacterized protein n=1 Tax=Caerostris extrusa TaxID=172846 RepID=A0AAV4NJ85_CAEEX|nr:uncharacterized protein CEXT_376311 [Caerostris extrusa]